MKKAKSDVEKRIESALERKEFDEASSLTREEFKEVLYSDDFFTEFSWHLDMILVLIVSGGRAYVGKYHAQ